MGFTQVDDETVQDDEGNRYFLPLAGTKPQTQDVPATVTRPGSTEVSMQYPPEGLPDLEALKAAPPSFTQLPSEAERGPSSPTPPPQEFIAKLPANPQKVSAEQARQGAMLDDATAFSQAGGVAKSDADMARIAGGRAAHEAETAKAKDTLLGIQGQGQIEKDKIQADLVLQTAAEYDQHVQKLQAESKAKWDAWNKRNEQATKNLVDPQHAFNSMGSLSKAGWALAFLGAGMQGGTQVTNVANVLNKIVEDDISAQQANITNTRKGLDEEKGMLMEQDKLGKDQLANWYAAKNLRLVAIGKQLDAKIAEMGLPAARQAGLLASRDVIEKEVVKTQQHVADHYNAKAEKEAGYAHDVYMARLQSALRKNEDEFKAGLKNSSDKLDTLPTGTQLGLQMVDKTTGQLVPAGKVKLKVKGEKAVEAGQVLAAANLEASLLNEVRDRLNNMSTMDLVRGGDAEFRALTRDLVQARAVRDNGKRLTDEDIIRAGQEEFGAKLAGKGPTDIADAIKVVGPYKEGVMKTIDNHLRNIAKETVNKLHPYIDSDDAERFDIQYNPQASHTEPVSKEGDDLNTAIIKAGNGADVSDLLVPGPRPAVTKDEPAPDELPKFQEERSKGRGVEGGLPRLPVREEDRVNQATAAFSHATPDKILKLAQSYLRDTKLSEEAKHEIRLTSLDALKEARVKEDAVLEEAIGQYQSQHHTVDPNNAETEGYVGESPYDTRGQFTPQFRKYWESGVVDEMRRRAGLVPHRH